jgi:hypothetical protein
MTFAQAYNATSPAEVTFDATVASRAHFFYGKHTHAEHESFVAQTAQGKVDVIDNVALAPPVPVRAGDRIEIRGELVHDPGRIPVVHWTHHDPSGEHADGFIRLRGKQYA